MKKSFAAFLVVIGLSVSAGAHADQVEEGRAAYYRGDYATALTLFQPLAEQGNATAQNALGAMYEDGLGVPQDDKEAFRLYELAAKQGYALGQTNLGIMYTRSYGFTQDLLSFLKSIFDPGTPRGYGKAFEYATELAVKRSRGFPQDYGEAVRLFDLAAQQGYATAQNYLGFMYANGLGVPQDDKEAFRLYELAAKRGYTLGQTNLAFMYAKGRGVPRDYEKAVGWYQLAAGLKYEQESTGFKYASGRGVPRDYKRAVSWYEWDAESRYTLGLSWALGENDLGFMYDGGVSPRALTCLKVSSRSKKSV